MVVSDMMHTSPLLATQCLHLLTFTKLKPKLYIPDYKHRRGFTAKETDHIKVQSSNGASSSSSSNRYSPYGRSSTSSSTHKPRHDDERKQENVYHVATQKYPTFEVIAKTSVRTSTLGMMNTDVLCR